MSRLLDWIRSVLSPAPDKTLELKSLRFRRITDNYARMLMFLIDVHEKQRGDFIFDKQYVIDTAQSAISIANEILFDSQVLTDTADSNRYRPVDDVKSRIRAVLQSRFDVTAQGRPVVSCGAEGDAEPEYVALSEIAAYLGCLSGENDPATLSAIVSEEHSTAARVIYQLAGSQRHRALSPGDVALPVLVFDFGLLSPGRTEHEHHLGTAAGICKPLRAFLDGVLASRAANHRSGGGPGPVALLMDAFLVVIHCRNRIVNVVGCQQTDSRFVSFQFWGVAAGGEERSRLAAAIDQVLGRQDCAYFKHSDGFSGVCAASDDTEMETRLRWVGHMVGWMWYCVDGGDVDVGDFRA